MRIREATADDVEAIRSIAHITWRDTYVGLLEPEWIRDYLARWYEPSLVAAQIGAAAETDGECFLIAEDDAHNPVGYLHFEQQPQRGPYLKRLYIHPDAQGSGAGTALVAELHSRLSPGSSYELDVHSENAKAIAFYRRLGAEFTGETLEPCWVLMRVEVGSRW